MRGDKEMRDCEECARLRAEYERLNKAYTTAVEATEAAYSAPSNQFLRLRIVSNEAWLEMEVARLELERHFERHRRTRVMSAVN
jgi:hypothetical protein